MQRQLRAATILAAALLGCGALTATARAADPSGNWKWSFNRQEGQSIDITLSLKAEGEKLTGSIGRNGQTTEIMNGTFKADEVSFTVVRERNGQSITSKYKGKVEGDAIRGKIEFELNGESRSFDWDAKREK
jgi:hypothetical protein